jgi:hypothetical protein
MTGPGTSVPPAIPSVSNKQSPLIASSEPEEVSGVTMVHVPLLEARTEQADDVPPRGFRDDVSTQSLSALVNMSELERYQQSLPPPTQGQGGYYEGARPVSTFL